MFKVLKVSSWSFNAVVHSYEGRYILYFRTYLKAVLVYTRLENYKTLQPMLAINCDTPKLFQISYVDR